MHDQNGWQAVNTSNIPNVYIPGVDQTLSATEYYISIFH